MSKENTVEVGDRLYIEEAWEDDSGAFHDEYVIVTKIYPDGHMRFRLDGDSKKRWRVQAWLNQMEWYANDFEPETKRYL